MGEDLRRAKAASKNSKVLAAQNGLNSLQVERRPLKTIHLAAPDYKVQPQYFLESYIEKEVCFAGIVPLVPIDLDMTNRTDVLKVVDHGKRERNVLGLTTSDNDAIFSISAQNVKLSRRDGSEDLLLRLPIHQIAAACYIRDDSEYIVAIKFGDQRLKDSLSLDQHDHLCRLVVLYCQNRTAAEELCSLLSQCFQLVYYTEAVVQNLDNDLNEVAAGLSIGGTDTVRTDYSSNGEQRKNISDKALGFLSQSSLDLGINSSLSSASLPRSQHADSLARSETELSPSASELIQKYMKKLHAKLNPEELREFAQLLRKWHSGMAFQEFCERVYELYGLDRKQLLRGMRPFIPEKDSEDFEDFLDRLGLNPDTTSPVWPRRKYSATSFVSDSENEETDWNLIG